MKQQFLSTKNTAFFSTANDPYIFQAATSLLSIRHFLPNAKLYIISKSISPKNKKFLTHHGISYIELDLTYLFFQIWKYPIECYYVFAGPRIFKNLGFKYSIYLDGDVLCLKNPIKNCPPIQDIGGVQADTFNELFGPDKDILAKEFNLSYKLFSKHHIQNGILYMNNERLVQLDLLEQCGKLYYDSWRKKYPHKKSDSLFALFQLANQAKLSPTILKDEYNYMPHLKKRSTANSIIFFHFTLDKPWKTRPYQHENANQNIFNTYIKKWRQVYKHNSWLKWLSTLYLPTIFFKKIKKIRKGLAQIPFVLKGIRYPIVKKRKNLNKPTIGLYWWEPPYIKNFGDIVSKDIIYNIFGFNTTWKPIETSDLIATGSIIEIAEQAKRTKLLKSWGSGFIRPDSGNLGLRHIHFSAIRGEKSLFRINYNVPTGDPGILINAAYSLKKKRHSKKIGVIIHYADIKTDIAKKFCEDNRFEVITPLDSPKNVAIKIASCGLILSSSLHGLIFADSLSVPNYHIKISNNLTGGTYKFLDYYSGIDKDYIPANLDKIFDDEYLLHLKKSYRPINKLTQKQLALIKSFPFK